MPKKYCQSSQSLLGSKTLNPNLLLAYWFPLIAWMVVIFSASGDTRSFQHSSRILGPLLLWLFPSMNEHALRVWILCGRKIAHLTEYAILAILVIRVLDATLPNLKRRATLAVVICCLYAATDEFHQKFVPTREASVVDVFIDTCGAAVAILVYRRRTLFGGPQNSGR